MGGKKTFSLFLGKSKPCTLWKALWTRGKLKGSEEGKVVKDIYITELISFVTSFETVAVEQGRDSFVFRHLASHFHCWEAKKAPNVYYFIIPAINKKRFNFSNFSRRSMKLENNTFSKTENQTSYKRFQKYLVPFCKSCDHLGSIFRSFVLHCNKKWKLLWQ